MEPPRLLLLLAALTSVAHGRDLIIATEKGLLTVNQSHVYEILDYENATSISGFATVPLAADSENSRVFYSVPQATSETGRPITGLMYVNVHHSANPPAQPVMLLFNDTAVNGIRGLAYDEISGILYWTNMIGHSIWKCTISSGCRDARRLRGLSKTKEPAAIALDPCQRYIYWTDNNHTSPSVNKMDMEGRKSTVIVSERLFMPNGIAVDPTGPGRIYWTDDYAGNAYKIESADLEGRDRRTEYNGHYQAPMDLAFAPPTEEEPRGALYWSDWVSSAVWKLDLNDKSKGPSALAYRGGLRNQPMGVVTKDSLLRANQC